MARARGGRLPAALAVAAYACGLALPIAIQADLALARLLHMAPAATFPVVELRLADFDSWPAAGQGTVSVPDTAVGLPVDATAEANTDPDTYGAYTLSAAAAQTVSDVISSLVRLMMSLCPSVSTRMPAPPRYTNLPAALRVDRQRCCLPQHSEAALL